MAARNVCSIAQVLRGKLLMAGSQFIRLRSRMGFSRASVRMTLVVAWLVAAGHGRGLADDRPFANHPRIVTLQENIRQVPSRVIGSPDPPLEFRTERAYPELRVSQPIAAANEPGSRRLLVITQDPGRLCRTSDRPESGELETLIEFPTGAVAYSIAFHPRFAENGYVYLGWNGFRNGTKASPDEKKRSIVTRYTMARQAPFELDVESALEIISWESDGHNGAAIAFGPDGMLYVTSGDGTSDSDTNLTGQRLDLLLAKLLRIDVDHPDPDRAYSIPSDNPFVGQDGVRPETFAYGFRNPWRMTIDEQTGRIWVGNNGQDLWEQVYLVTAGANYGWSVYEGGHLFYAERKTGPHPVSKPIFDHPHSEARSLTGGIVYYGTRLPQLYGAYVYGDYSTGKIWAAKLDGNQVIWHAEIADSTLSIAGFARDADGELLIVDHRKDDGGLYTLVPNDRPRDPARFPDRLSRTGLWEDVARNRLHPGAIPYSVNAPLWSDHAIKQRFLVLPAGTERAGFHPSDSWTFPDQTVAVKSFALELTAGDPASRKWIETRLLVKQEGEWTGYSYRWDDDQQEAWLVESAGMDRSYVVTLPDGSLRDQVWHYPGRAECMVCHSRAARFVLGLSTLQLNRKHDYGGVTANQIDVLRHLSVIADGKPVEELERLVDPHDETVDLELRARSYLHANCAQCHVPAGGGNAQFDASFLKPLEKTRLIDERPQHHTYGIEDARLVSPGEPDRSILLQRISRRGRGQMPQLGTELVDERAVELLKRWISQLKQ